MGKVKVVVVEDESIVAKDIQNSLKNMGYGVPAVVSSGEKAIEAVHKFRPDLVLMDIMLKGEMSGIEAAKIIKDRFDIPVIFLTAYADEDTLDKAKPSVPYGYVIKPFKEKELETTIEMAINKHIQDTEIRKERDLYQAIVLRKDEPDSIFVRADYRLNKIKFTDIYFVEALKDYVVINTSDNIYTTHTTMKEMIRILPDKDFVRVHRSFIVRLDKIFSIKYPDLVIEGKMKVIPIGGLYRKELFGRLNLV
jgi:two-component system, LytTR family, response regulator LytT